MGIPNITNFKFRIFKTGIAHFQQKEYLYLKGQSNEIFDLQFFSSFELALGTDQWVKIFLNLVKNWQSY